MHLPICCERVLMMGVFTNRGNLPPSDAASEGVPYRGWATALPSPTQRPAPIHECTADDSPGR